MSKLAVKNLKGESVGEFEFADNLMLLDKGDHAVHEAVVAYMTHQRAGTASTLTKAGVTGTGTRPWKQKGLGRARAGFKQSPVWRSGGVAHGPHPRKRHKKVNKMVTKLAFQRAFSAKVEQNEITVIDELTVSAPKTKEFQAILNGLNLERGGLFVVDSIEENVRLAARNIPRVEVVTADVVNTYKILRYKDVIITKAAMETLEKRLG